MGLLDTEDAIDVSAFLLLSQCKKVKSIFYDDFKWRDLRGKGREYLIENKDKFGSKVSFVQPKKLKNYNFDTQSFEVDPELQTFVKEFASDPVVTSHDENGFPGDA